MTNAYKKIFEFYGARHQAKKLMEETAELAEAIEDYVDCASSKTLAHVAEEIADCMVVSNQLVLAYFDDENKLMEDILDDLHGDNPVENATEGIAKEAANIISAVAHYENTGEDKDVLKERIRKYKVWLHLIRLKIKIKAKPIKGIMDYKIHRQLTRIEF